MARPKKGTEKTANANAALVKAEQKANKKPSNKIVKDNKVKKTSKAENAELPKDNKRKRVWVAQDLNEFETLAYTLHQLIISRMDNWLAHPEKIKSPRGKAEQTEFMAFRAKVVEALKHLDKETDVQIGSFLVDVAPTDNALWNTLLLAGWIGAKYGAQCEELGLAEGDARINGLEEQRKAQNARIEYLEEKLAEYERASESPHFKPKAGVVCPKERNRKTGLLAKRDSRVPSKSVKFKGQKRIQK